MRYILFIISIYTPLLQAKPTYSFYRCTYQGKQILQDTPCNKVNTQTQKNSTHQKTNDSSIITPKPEYIDNIAKTNTAEIASLDNIPSFLHPMVSHIFSSQNNIQHIATFLRKILFLPYPTA